MTSEEIRDLFKFNEWANKRFIDAVKNLSKEKYNVEIKSSFSSIRQTISHIAGSEWIWMQRLMGNKPIAPPDWFDTRSTETLSQKLKEVETDRNKYLSGLNDEELNKTLNYNLLSGKPQQNTIREILQHVINHSTYHRGQLATLFRQIDETPPSTDLILFYREHR